MRGRTRALTGARATPGPRGPYETLGATLRGALGAARLVEGIEQNAIALFAVNVAPARFAIGVRLAGIMAYPRRLSARCFAHRRGSWRTSRRPVAWPAVFPLKPPAGAARVEAPLVGTLRLGRRTRHVLELLRH